jgi:hypothetical protein
MRKLTLSYLVFLSVLASLSSTAVASNDVPMSSDDQVVVFGKFRLLKNGYEMQFGDGIFGNVAVLRLYRADDQEEFTIRVGKGGEFSQRLAPGDYYVMNVSFKYRGETIRPETNFMFNVSGDRSANYLGTLTLEATFGSDYNGTKGSFERFVVADECASVCEHRLAELGLANADVTTSLPEWQTQVAMNR